MGTFRLWAAGATLGVCWLVSCGDSQDGGAPGSSAAAGESADAGASSGGKSGSNTGGSDAQLAGAPGSAHGGDTGQAGMAPGASGGAPSSAAGAAGQSEGGAALGLGGAAGESSQAGAGGASSQMPSCDDAKATTTDIYNPLYGCAHLTDDVPGGGDGWYYYDAGFYVDERTGAAWSPLTTQGSLATAQTFCAALQIGSLSNWRVPIIDEVRASFAGGCPATAPTGTCTIHDPGHLSSAEVYGIACESCLGSGTSAYCPKNAPFCQWLKTSSVCSDCAGEKGWTYGPSNGNFAAINLADPIGVSCVIPALPGGVP